MSSGKVAATEIPVIDLSSSSPTIAIDVLKAASEYGFLFVENHDLGIPPEAIQSMFDLSREFFQSPKAVKEECSVHSSQSGKNRGWISMHTETLDPAKHKRGDFKEAFNFGEFVNGKANQPLPAPLVPYEARISYFTDSCHALCNRILQLFAKALDIPASEGGEEWFSQRHDRSKGPSGSVMRLLYYPTLKSIGDFNVEEDIRAGAHSDYGSITLLFRLPSQPGLEILNSSNTWSPVPLNPLSSLHLPILVNIGDLLSYWTNGLLKSTVHRVVFPAPASPFPDPTSINTNGSPAANPQASTSNHEPTNEPTTFPDTNSSSETLPTSKPASASALPSSHPNPPNPPTDLSPPSKLAPEEMLNGANGITQIPPAQELSDDADRYTIAYFCHPLDSASLVPVPSALVHIRGERVREEGVGYGGGIGEVGRDEVLMAKEHLERRLKATYGL